MGVAVCRGCGVRGCLCLRLSTGVGAVGGKGGTHIEILAREDDDLVELGEVGDEVVHAWAFCGAPTVFSLVGGILAHGIWVVKKEV